jgi:hypothetical protein
MGIYQRVTADDYQDLMPFHGMMRARKTANDLHQLLPFSGFGETPVVIPDMPSTPGLGIDLTGDSGVPTWAWIVGGVLAYHLFVKKLW